MIIGFDKYHIITQKKQIINHFLDHLNKAKDNDLIQDRVLLLALHIKLHEQNVYHNQKNDGYT